MGCWNEGSDFSHHLVISTSVVLGICLLAVAARRGCMVFWGGKMIANDNGILKVCQ